MKKKTPPFNELIERFVQSIQLKHPDVPITENGIKILQSTWKGKDERLYTKVKQMENEEVKFNNLKRRIDHRVMETQIGVDILGFPIYLTHENVFQNDVDRKYRNGKSNQILIRSWEYITKQN